MLIENCKASLVVDLQVMAMPYRAFLQGACFSDGYWWLCSAQKDLSGAGGAESNHISKFDSKGKYLGRMTLLGSGHGSAFSMRGDEVWIGWFDDTTESDRSIRRITWEKNAKAKRSDATLVNTGTQGTAYIVGGPGPADTDFALRRFRSDLSPDHDQHSLRSYSNPSGVRRRMICPQVKPDKDWEPNGDPISNPSATYQGSMSWGGSVFALYAGTRARPQWIAQYNWPGDSTERTVKPISKLDITNIPAGWKSWTGSHEPEGFCVYSGKLCFGVRFGPTSKRYFRVYMLDDKTGPPPVTPTPPWPPVIVPPKPPVDACAPIVVPHEPEPEPIEGEPQ